MIKYRCIGCKKEFTGEEFKSLSDGMCPVCSALIRKEEEAFVGSLTTPPEEGECGLGILVFDFSGSMNERAFSEDKYNEYEQRKIDLVSGALCGSLPFMKGISQSKNAYIALIGFTDQAEILGFKRASEIEDAEYWKNWLIEKREAMLEHGNRTNISAALRLAKEIYDAALKGEMKKKYGLEDFSGLMQQGVIVGGTTVKIANMRVLLYSDGDHYASEEFKNYFEGATILNTEKTNVSGLITVFFGKANSNGYRRLEEISGVCPIHNAKGIISIQSPESYEYLRKIFHMTSNATGFCPECAKELLLKNQ